MNATAYIVVGAMPPTSVVTSTVSVIIVSIAGGLFTQLLGHRITVALSRKMATVLVLLIFSPRTLESPSLEKRCDLMSSLYGILLFNPTVFS